MSENKHRPAAEWRERGEPDPHGNTYDCTRDKLCMGNLTDDELANAAFMNYDRWPSMQELLAGKAFTPIAYMTAVKDRIRWLSRQLEGEKAAAQNYRNDAITAMRQRDELLKARQALGADIANLTNQRDELLSLLVEFSDALPSDDYMAAQGQTPGPLLQRIRLAIASAKGEAPTTCTKCNTPDLCREYGRACDPYPGQDAETSVPAIVFYPAGSLGEQVESEGGAA